MPSIRCVGCISKEKRKARMDESYFGQPTLYLNGKKVGHITSVDLSRCEDNGVVRLFPRQDSISLTYDISNCGFDWKDYRRRYTKRYKKILCWAVTHGYAVHSNYYEDGFDIKFVILRTPRQVKRFLEKAWHCPNLKIEDRWMMAYKIKKGRIVPVCVWKDASELVDKYERIYAKQ